MGFSAILQLLNLVIPQVASVITVIRNANGTHSVLFYLDAADTQFAANEQGLADWLKAHGAAPTNPAP